LNFDDFIKKFPELQFAPHNTQQNDFEFFEKTRIQRVEEFLEEKKKLPNDFNPKDSNYISNMGLSMNLSKKNLSQSKLDSNSVIFRGATKVDEEMKSLEISKKRKEQEIINVLKQKVLAERNIQTDERHQQHILESRMVRTHIFEIRNEKEQKLKTLRLNKILSLDNSEEERKRIEEKHMDNAKRLQQEIEKEKKKRKDFQEKEIENKKKRDEELLKMEKYNQEQINKALENKKIMEEKEFIRQEYIRKKNEKVLRESQEKAIKMKDKIEQTLKNLDDKLIKQRVVFIKYFMFLYCFYIVFILFFFFYFFLY